MSEDSERLDFARGVKKWWKIGTRVLKKVAVHSYRRGLGFMNKLTSFFLLIGGRAWFCGGTGTLSCERMEFGGLEPCFVG